MANCCQNVRGNKTNKRPKLQQQQQQQKTKQQQQQTGRRGRGFKKQITNQMV